MRGTEAVEEVDERHATLDGSQMRHRRQIHDFLRVSLRQHGKAGLTAGIHVGVIAEDVQRVRCHAARGNMEHGGEQLARYFVHVRDHQQKTLRRRVGGGQRTGSQRAVHRTGSTCLGLHLRDLDRRAEDVFLTCCGPLIHIVSHGAGRGDRIDTRDLGICIRHICRSIVTVHGFELSCH